MEKLHWNTVSGPLKNIIKIISTHPTFGSFVLGGGTALALQLGHRISVDADFITDTEINAEELQKHILDVLPHATNFRSGQHGVFCTVDGIKVDFLTWKIPFIRNHVTLDGVVLSPLEEIAAMKLYAVTRRGEKKDYMDLACLLQKFSVEQMLNFYNERHPKEDVSIIPKYLLSFADIDKQPDPIMLHNLTWQTAKHELATAVKEYLTT